MGKRISFKNKNVLLFILLLAVSLPVTVFYLQQQQSTKQQAQVVTTYTYVRQAVYSIDGLTGWSRDCNINSLAGAQFSQCTPWSSPIDLRTSRGVGNESYGAYSAFTYSKNGQQILRQAIVSKDGLSSWSRDCPYYTWGLETGAKSDCTGWSGAVNNLTSARGVGGESYSGFSAFIYSTSTATKLRQALLSMDGKTSWSRDCLVDSAGPNFNQCDTTWSGSLNNIASVRGIGNESYGSYSGTVITLNGQQTLRQVLVTLDGSAGYVRNCPVDSVNGITCPSGGWQDVNIASLRGVGGERYGAFEEIMYATRLNLMPAGRPSFVPRSGAPLLGAGGIQTSQMSDAAFTNALLHFGFRSMTPGATLKMNFTEPQQDVFSFTNVDPIINFATSHGLAVRGHTLIWHYPGALPPWFVNGTFSRTQMIAIMRDYIAGVMGHYKGTIKEWDVVNEAVEDDATMRQTKWLQTIGPDYIDLAFRFAHEVDPSAKLFYNDYGGEGINAKSDTIYNLVKGMIDRGVPIHGVGLQSHFSFDSTNQNISANIARLAALGLEVNITEADVAVFEDPPSATKLQQQANVYKFLAQECNQAPSCKTFTTWGLYDGYSWIYTFYNRPDAPLLLNKQYQPKPAYYALAPYIANILSPTLPPSVTPIPPTPTRTPTPTPTGGTGGPPPSLTPTRTPTPSPTGSTGSPSPTRTPTPSPTGVGPSPSIVPGHTAFLLDILAHGIGSAGDNSNPTGGGGNRNPLTTTRSVRVDIYDATGRLTVQPTGAVTYKPTTGTFGGTIDVGSLPTGFYTAYVRMDKYLVRRIAGIISVVAGQIATLPQFNLITGDTNNDNRLNVLDYNLILDCFSGISPARNCADTTKKFMTDLTDDGNVDQFDYNLFLRELSVQAGD